MSKPITVELASIRTAHAFCGKKLVGLASAWTDEDRFCVLRVGVHEPYRRRGIATALYSAIESANDTQLLPSHSLSDDGFYFWKSFRPASVADDLRHWGAQLIGKMASKNGHLGRITSVYAGVATLEYLEAQPGGTQSCLLRRDINAALSKAGSTPIDFDAGLEIRMKDLACNKFQLQRRGGHGI